MRQQHRIALAFAQRRDVDHDLGQAVIQVFTKPAFADLGFQVLVGGADHPHIDRNLLAPTDALDLALLQEAQQLGLQGMRQIADFIEHQGAAVGGLDLADGGLAGPGERAALIAKQLAFEQRLGDRCAVDGDKFSAAFGRLVQALRQHLFASAALAQQHHGGGAGGHALDHAAGAQHLGVTGEQAAQGVGLVQRLQTPVLGLQFEQPERAVNRQSQQLRLEGLGKKVVGPQRNGAQRIRLVVLAGEHDHLDVGVQRQQLLQQAKAFADGIRVRRQPQVHGDHRRLMPPELHQCALAVAGGD